MWSITPTNKYCYHFSHYVRSYDDYSGSPFKKIYYVENEETLGEEDLIQFTNNDSVIGYTLISLCKLRNKGRRRRLRRIQTMKRA